MRQLFIAALLVLAGAATLEAQHVAYEVSFPNRFQHEAEISVTFTDIASETPLEVRMSRTSPGRYALHEFAKNVYNVHAYAGDGGELAISRPNPHQWDVTGHDGTVRMTYTLFGDRADGTYTGINSRYAHLNMPATFMWARGMREAPVDIVFNLPIDTWDIATQLFPREGAGHYGAPDFWYFMDSPTHIGQIKWRSWTVQDDDHRSATIRLAVDHDGLPESLDAYQKMAQLIVAEQIAMWGELPAFDADTYTFIAAYLPYVDGDGMEHLNSTFLTSTHGLDGDGALARLGTLSHEFFHAWNVERLRPADLEPFDFEETNMTDALWFAEGFTSYYTDAFIRRTGLIDNVEYASRLSSVVNTVRNAPGRQIHTAAEMSMLAPFRDAATSIDPQNKRNTFISYYTWGAGIALGLDLTLRRDFGLTLDTFMRAMWDQYGRQQKPYTVGDLRRVLGEMTGNEDFAKDFFARFIFGHEALDYGELLALAGFSVQPAAPGSVWLGAPFTDTQDGALVADQPTRGSTFQSAGISRRDIIRKFDGKNVNAAHELRDIVAELDSGTRVSIVFEQNGETRSVEIELVEDPSVNVVPFEEMDLEITHGIYSFRESWLGSRK